MLSTRHFFSISDVFHAYCCNISIRMPPIDQSKLQENIKKLTSGLREKYSNILHLKSLEGHHPLGLELNPITRFNLRGNSFVQELTNLNRLTDRYENDEFQEAALEAIPFDKIYATVDANLAKQDQEIKDKDKDKNSSVPNYSYEDLLVKEVLRWFKEDFFKWVNKDPCPFCNNDNQDKLQLTSCEPANQQERNEGDASNTEIYKCLQCNKSHRFPRYNNPKMLLRTRKGRCGEYANCFYLILRSLSVSPVRYIWNREDHLWTEYYSTNFEKWIHLDSCENAYNEPLLYCNNWGKKMSYVFGVSTTGFADLSNKYIDQRGNKDKQLPRNAVDEKVLKKIVRYFDLKKKSQIRDKKELYNVIMMDNIERKLLNNPEEIYNTTLVENHGQKGRISGSSGWKKERGEGSG